MPISHEPDHARIARLLTHTEKLAAELDQYETKDFNLIAIEEIKTRFRHSADQLRLLGKTLVIEVDDGRSLTDPWKEIVPLYLQRKAH